MEKLIDIIENQQKGHESEPIFMIGEQLKDIASREPASAEILEQDLAVENMGLAAAAGALKKYADDNHGKNQCFCITPNVAEKILREFYSLPNPAEAVKTAETPSNSYIDLSSFL